MAKKKKLTKAERKEARLRKGKQWLLTVIAGPFCPETAELFCLAAELICQSSRPILSNSRANLS